MAISYGSADQKIDRNIVDSILKRGFPQSSIGKETACNAEDPGLIPGLGRSPGEGNEPTPVFLPEKPMDRGAWQATVHGVASVGHDLVTKPPPSPPYLNSRHGLGLGLGGADGEASVCDAEDPGLIPGLGRSPGEGNSNPLQYSCWRIPWTEEPGGLPPMGSQRVGHNGATSRQTVDTQDGRKGHPWGDDGHH